VEFREHILSGSTRVHEAGKALLLQLGHTSVLDLFVEVTSLYFANPWHLQLEHRTIKYFRPKIETILLPNFPSPGKRTGRPTLAASEETKEFQFVF